MQYLIKIQNTSTLKFAPSCQHAFSWHDRIGNHHGRDTEMHVELANTPESNPQLLARSLKLYCASLLHVFGLALFIALIVWLSRFAVSSFGWQQIKLIYLDVCVFIIGILIYFIFTALLWRMRCVITQAHENIFDDLLVASKKILLIVGAALIQAFLVMLMTVTVYYLAYFIQKQPPLYAFYLTMVVFILYTLVFVYVYYLLIFYLPLILTEDKGIFSALMKSVSLVWGNWWRVFLLQIIPLGSYFVCIFILSWIFHVNINIYLSETPLYILATVLNLFLIALFIPFNGAVLLVQLRDLELRKAVSYPKK